MMAGTPKDGRWNADMIERLSQLWLEGLSARIIGESLGVTKNAVIGKAHKLRLAPRPSPIKCAVRKDASSPLKALGHLEITQLMQTPRSSTPYTGPNTFDQLALDQCRYTASETKPFVFCAKPVIGNGPYCAEHHEVCYINRSKRAQHEAAAWKPWKHWS